ncbi:MAG: hypothetical protein FJ039_08755 [Chloroflexi bacterium]|nr:hypothetical protein [Chloroflexota bacterium]
MKAKHAGKRPSSKGQARPPVTGLLLVLTRCKDPVREEEFNRWYDGVHIPHVLETNAPGLHTVRRYKNTSPQPGDPGYLAVYDMSGRDPERTFARMRAGMNARRAQGTTYTSDTLDIMHVQTYKRIKLKERYGSQADRFHGGARQQHHARF